MRIGYWVAIAAVMLTASGARAADPQAAVAMADVFEIVRDAADQPGVRLTHSLRLRIDGMTDNLGAVAYGVSPLRKQLVDPTRRRGFNSALDFFPMRDNGFHLTAGMRRSPKRLRWNPGATGDYPFFSPRLSMPQLVKSNVARSSPMAMAGWSGEVGRAAFFSLSAGVLQEHGKSLKMNSAMIARQQSTSAGWSRIGEVVQASFALGF